MYIFRWDLYVIDRYVVMRRKWLTYQDAWRAAVSFLAAKKRICQSSAEAHILPKLLTPLGASNF